MKRWLGGIALLLVVAALVGLRATYVGAFPLVKDEIGGPAATPPVLGPFGNDPAVATVADWEDRRAPLLREAFAREIYGPMPPDLPAEVLARQPLDGDRVAGGMRVEQLTIGFGAAGDRGRVNVVLARPAGPVRALLVVQNFCGNALALHKRYDEVRSLRPPPDMCEGFLKAPAGIILGRWIDGPPLERVLERGYAVAIVYAADLVPDAATASKPALERLYGPGAEAGGALAAWAWLYDALGGALTRDSGLEGAPVVAWGHSRNGKAALLAGAVYPGIAGVISHQSGRGGAALNRSPVGESIAQITDNFGFWFSPRYAAFAGREGEMTVDQHQLLALIAPRPVLLGAGDRDRWSDPAGAFRAAQGADPVWRLYGKPGLEQTQLSEPDLTRPLASFMRKGTHGVTTRDWDNFLTWLDANFPPR
jgi:hypothetical protein